MPSVAFLALCSVFPLNCVSAFGAEDSDAAELREICREQDEALPLGSSGPLRRCLCFGTVDGRCL